MKSVDLETPGQFDLGELIVKAFAQFPEDKIEHKVFENVLSSLRVIEQQKAERQFNKAFAKFRSEVGHAKTTQKASTYSGQSYEYAGLEDVVNALQWPLSNNGFSYYFSGMFAEKRYNQCMTLEDGTIQIACTLTHEAGHSITTGISYLPKYDALDVVSQIQSLGIHLTYLKRYLLTSITGIATEDVDGKSEKPSRPTNDKLEKKLNEEKAKNDS